MIKLILYRYKFRLHRFSHVIFKMTVFALVFGFIKMSGHIVNFSEESKLSNDSLNIKQLTNIHISHM